MPDLFFPHSIESFEKCTFDVGDGSVRIWKDYASKAQQKLVTAFSSIQGHRPGVRRVNAVVDWQQQSGCLVLFETLLC